MWGYTFLIIDTHKDMKGSWACIKGVIVKSKAQP